MLHTVPKVNASYLHLTKLSLKSKAKKGKKNGALSDKVLQAPIKKKISLQSCTNLNSQYVCNNIILKIY